MLEEPIGSGWNEVSYAVSEGTECGCGGLLLRQGNLLICSRCGHLLCAECGGETIPDGGCAVCLSCAASSCGL